MDVAGSSPVSLAIILQKVLKKFSAFFVVIVLIFVKKQTHADPVEKITTSVIYFRHYRNVHLSPYAWISQNSGHYLFVA